MFLTDSYLAWMQRKFALMSYKNNPFFANRIKNDATAAELRMIADAMEHHVSTR